MGVGTARLLFQVFSTLIYIYRHLTNPPQSPNCISQLYFTSLYICISLCCLYLPFSTWLIYRSHQIEMSPSSLHPLPPTYANSNPNILMSSFEKVFSNNPFLNYTIQLYALCPIHIHTKEKHSMKFHVAGALLNRNLNKSQQICGLLLYTAHPRPPSHPKDRARDSREGHYCCRHLL